MHTAPLDARSVAPLLVTPVAGDAALDTLLSWINADPNRTQRLLLEHGALLFRGFSVPDPDSFERVSRAIAPDLKNDYLGTSPRDAVTPYVFTASELPGHYPIPQHCEMTFVKTPPEHLFFCCLTPNGGAGGETPRRYCLLFSWGQS